MRLYAFCTLLVSLAALSSVVRALDDDDDSGCVMSAGSDLMNCLGTWASLPPVPSSTGSGVGQSAQELCDQYSQMVGCWAAGTYCREWLPLRTAADKFCALAKAASLSPSAVPSETFSSVSAEASEVVTSIWNNDSGTDVPSITNDVGSVTRPTWTHAESAPTQTGTAATASPSTSASGTVGAGADADAGLGSGTSGATAARGAAAQGWAEAALLGVVGAVAVLAV